MIDFETLASAVTVVAVTAFVGIVIWTMSRRQTRRFDEAARLPFALPDDPVAETRQQPAGPRP